MPSRAAFSSMAWPSAMSDSDRPRCQNRMVSSSRSRPGLTPGDDLADLAVQGRLGQLALLDMGAQRAELSGLALPPVVHDHLGHDIGQRQLDRAHGPVRNDQRARLDPGGLQHRRWRRQARRFDHDIGALDTGAPILGRPHGFAEIAGEARGEGVAAFRPARMHADLGKVEQMVEQAHIPVGGAARADMAEHARILAREVLCADRRHGAGPHVGQVAPVDDRLGNAVARVHQQQQADLGGKSFLVVVDIVADHLDAGEIDRRPECAAQDVEMPLHGGIGHQMHARLDHRFTAALRGKTRLDRADDLARRSAPAPRRPAH